MRPASSLAAADEVLDALSDATRRRVLDVLAARGAASATRLADDLPVTRQAIVKHLAVLEAAGLVTGARVSREVRYAVVPDRLASAGRLMAAVAADWDRRLVALKRIAEAD
jgi:DNA-binding transcriptional ArsR family regulator